MRLTWQRVLQAAALADFALLVIVALVLGDLEAFAFSAVVLASTAWVALRPSRVAAVVRGLVFANVLFWMVPGVLSNLAGHATLGALLAPMALAGTSALGLLATVAWLAFPARRRMPSRAATVATIVMLAALVGGSGVAAANASSTGLSGAGALVISAKNAKFSTSSLTAPAGTVTVEFTNEDLFWHTFTSKDLDVDLRVPVRAQRKATFTARPGVYEYHCAIPGHESIGMRGTVTVR